MNRRAIGQLLGFVRPYRWALPGLVVLGMLASASEGLGIGLLVPLLQTILGGEGAQGAGPVVGLVQRYADGFDGRLRMPVIAASIVALVLLKSVILYGTSLLFAWINGRVSHAIRSALFRQLLGVGYIFLSRTDQGRLLNTLGGETWRTTEAMSVVFSLAINLCTVVVFTTLLLLISWPLTLVVAAGVTLTSLCVRLVARRARRVGDEAVAASTELTERMAEALGSMRVIRAFGQEAREQARFDRASNRVRRSFLSMDRICAAIHPLLEVLYAPLFLGTLAFARHLGIELPTLLAFLLLLYRLQPQVKALDHNRVQLAALAGAVTEVASLLDEADKPYVRSGPLPFGGLERSVVFRNVGFRYGPDGDSRPALSGASFEIKKGQVTAIVGGSGAGKSTIASLLYRFYDPTEGEVLVDGRPLRDLDVAAWRAHLGIAGQDIDLLSETVEANIAYGRPGAGLAAVTAAARRADAHEFILGLPQGYETRVGERGLRLSGGQRQRIGLARALLRDPDILILDEATNALDGLSQGAIQEALERLPKRTTAVVIAHRLSTIRNADHVIVLQDGRVVESGRPADLVEARGVFATLYEHELGALGPAGRWAARRARTNTAV
jgi:subfamily B ATP-binding cassette protein MsbA